MAALRPPAHPQSPVPGGRCPPPGPRPCPPHPVWAPGSSFHTSCGQGQACPGPGQWSELFTVPCSPDTAPQCPHPTPREPPRRPLHTSAELQAPPTRGAFRAHLPRPLPRPHLSVCVWPGLESRPDPAPAAPTWQWARGALAPESWEPPILTGPSPTTGTWGACMPEPLGGGRSSGPAPRPWGVRWPASWGGAPDSGLGSCREDLGLGEGRDHQAGMGLGRSPWEPTLPRGHLGAGPAEWALSSVPALGCETTWPGGGPHGRLRLRGAEGWLGG